MNIRGLDDVSAVVRTAIWELRSKLTNKSQIKPEEKPAIFEKLQELYRVMEADLDAIACKIISKRCS